MEKINYVVLDNLRSAHNTGNIYRSAYSFGFKGVIHVGVTPDRGNPNFMSSSRGCEEFLETKRFEDIIQAIEFLKQSEFNIYSLEMADNSVSLGKMDIKEPFAIILGNEALGVSEYALKSSDKIISISTPGYKDSLNVAVSFGIFAYVFSINR